MIYLDLNNLLNWIFLKWFWIEYWIESILRKIQTLNWINLGIEQGYREEEGGEVVEQVDHQHTCSCWAGGEAEVQGKTYLKNNKFSNRAKTTIDIFTTSATSLAVTIIRTRATAGVVGSDVKEGNLSLSKAIAISCLVCLCSSGNRVSFGFRVSSALEGKQ